jgi:SAM-dependent methyltransferase
MDTLAHLQGHHGDFAAFRDLMIETSPGRFGPLFWGAIEQLAQPRADGTFVDLGCGPGVLLGHLRQRYAAARVIGVEMQPAMLDAARTVAADSGAEIVEADLAAEVPLPDGIADMVTAIHVLHEIPRPMQFLATLRRLLKPGGVLVLYDWVRRPLRDYLEDRALSDDSIEHFREHCLYAPEDIEWMLGQHGFSIRETLGRRGGRYAVVFAERAA